MTKQQPFEALLTDVDRTILDTKRFIYESFYHTLQIHHLPSITQENLDPFMGIPLEQCYSVIAPHADPLELAETHKTFQDSHLFLSVPYPHTKQTLKVLNKNNIKIAAVTSRSRRSSEKTITLAGLMPYLHTIVYKEDVDPRELKPHPRPILLALEKLKVHPKNAIYIGDTKEDVEAGKRAGTKTIGVTYGSAGQRIRDSHPDYIVNDIEDIIPILLPH